MCRDGEAHRLFTLPISGMEGYIEDDLDLRARTADPLAAPFYHKILYSWLIMRQDYRKGKESPDDRFPDLEADSVTLVELTAALAQYQYADRIKLLTAKSADDYRSHLVIRSRSLLAASNSLSLVEPENAWFTTYTTGRTESGEPVCLRPRLFIRLVADVQACPAIKTSPCILANTDQRVHPGYSPTYRHRDHRSHQEGSGSRLTELDD